MTGIVHKAVKVSGEKGLATEWNDDHEITGNIDQDQNQFLNQVIENRTDFPAGPVEGQVIYRSDLNRFYVYDGTNWVYYITADGNTPFTGDQSMGGHSLTNVVTIHSPTNETMLISASGVATFLSLYGSSGITFNVDAGKTISFLDNVTMNAHKILSLANGTAATDAAAFGQIGIVSGTHYWSCMGNHFTAANPDTDAVQGHPDEGTLTLEADGIDFTAAVNLPHGAVVTGAIVYGSETDETWYLRRMEMGNPGFATTMASAVVETEDNTINNATINNSQYAYFFEVGGDNTDEIYGARITYTL